MQDRRTLIALALLISACAPAPKGSPASPPVPVATTTASPTAEPTAGWIGADDVVATLAGDLPVMATPGTDQEVLGTLERGQTAFVMAAGVTVDGVAWYPLSGLGMTPGTGCEAPPDPLPFGYCGAWRGWVAGAGPDGEAWLGVSEVNGCPAPDVDSMTSVSFVYRLICFGDRKLTFTGYWPKLPPDVGLGGACPDAETDVGWLVCQNINHKVVTASETAHAFFGIRLSINPVSNVVMPKRGQWLRIAGHFDDPAAQRCGEPADLSADPIGAVYACRLEFVATSIKPTSAP